jgi:hypothetical protein
MLSKKEIQLLNDSIKKLDTGRYELRSILGEQWDLIESPTSFGKRFKKYVLDGGLKGISFVDIKTNNHNIYKLKK